MSDPLTPKVSAPPAARRPHTPRIRFDGRHEPSGRTRVVGPRRRRAPRASVLAALLSVGLALLVVGLLPALPVSGAPANAPNFTGSYIVGGGAALVDIGYVGFANVWVAAGNGTSVYSNTFYLVFFNLRTVPSSVLLSVRQDDGYITNQTVVVPPLGGTAISLTLPEKTAWIGTVLSFDGTAIWSGSVATPISLFPNYIFDVGGLDLFALVLVSLMMINIMGGVVAARAVIRRSVWAPKFSMLAWGHLTIALIGGFIFLDYQAVDSLFAGWSPVVYPFFTFPMAFLWALSLFNRAEVVQVQTGTRTGSGGLGYYLTEIRVGRLPRERGGKLVYVEENWGGMWARFWGHFTPVEASGPSSENPWLAPVVRLLSPTASYRSRRKARKMAARAFPNAGDALTRFPVLNPDHRRNISYIAVGKDDVLPVILFARLSIYRERTVERTRVIDGVPTTEKYTRRRLSLPHYVDAPVGAAPALENEHYEPAAAVLAHFGTVRDLGRAFSKIAHAFDVLESTIENRIQDEAYSKLRIRMALRGRTSSGISAEEAASMAGATGALLDPPKGVGP